jgi:hypothetical protein
LWTWAPLPPAAQQARALAPAFDQVARLHCALGGASRCSAVESIAAQLAAGDAGAVGAADQLLAELAAARDASLDDRAEGALRVRVGGMIALAVAVSAALWRWRRSLGERLAPCAPLLLATAYASVLWLRGYRATFSKMSPRDTFFLEAGLAITVATAAALLAFRRTRGAPGWLLGGTVIPVTLLALHAGIDPRSLPHPITGVLVFMLSPVVLAGAISAVILELLDRRAH